jgi:hypothetical protein
VTDLNGDYTLKDLPPNEYLVGEVPQPDWRQTMPGESPPSGVPGFHRVTVHGGDEITGIDFGNRGETPIDRTSPTVIDVEWMWIRTTVRFVQINFSEDLDPVPAVDLANFSVTTIGSDRRFGTGHDRAIPIRSATYDAATHSVTLRTRAPLTTNHFYRLAVLGGGAITDLSGNPFDGDLATGKLDDFMETVGRGNRLLYIDSDGDIVLLHLTRGGEMELNLSPNGDAESLTLLDIAPGRSTLSGDVRTTRYGGDGTAIINSIAGTSGVNVNLQAPQFEIGTLAAAVVDSLFDSDEWLGGLRPRRRG